MKAEDPAGQVRSRRGKKKPQLNVFRKPRGSRSSLDLWSG